MDTTSAIRVLIAEDDALVSAVIWDLVESLGHTIVGEAADGQQAVDLTDSLRPDVVLMDLDMPGMDGLQAAREIQSRCPTPVVMLTAYETPDLVRQASQVGAGAYLVKPSNQSDLERAIIIAMARFGDLMTLSSLNDDLQTRNRELEAALAQVKTLQGLLPICAHCKKIRDDQGYWNQVEVYIQRHSDAQFTHGICPSCAKKYYSHLFEDESK